MILQRASPLKIKKGHVRVHGSIGNISREGTENGDVTYIIKEDGANITGTVGETSQYQEEKKSKEIP